MSPPSTAIALADFLLARVAEDEEVARAVADDVQGLDCELHETWEPHPGGLCPTNWRAGGWEHAALSDPASRFITWWSPERVLAECAAKRLAVAHLRDAEKLLAREERHPTGDADDWDALDRIRMAVECMVTHLAAVYQGHPDFDPDWAGWMPTQDQLATSATTEETR